MGWGGDNDVKHKSRKTFWIFTLNKIETTPTINRVAHLLLIARVYKGVCDIGLGNGWNVTF